MIPSTITCEYIKRRGPDCYNTIYREFNGGSLQASDSPELKASMIFSTSVLSLRGNFIAEQPLEDSQTGSILCWNGEAWKINDRVCEGNDAKAVFDELLQAVKPNMIPSSAEKTALAVINALRNVSGPGAFVFYDGLNQNVFYGRDRLGRRSLLQAVDSSGNLLISSVCHPSGFETWTEVKAGSMCVLDLTKYIHRGPYQANIYEHEESFNDSLGKPKLGHIGETLLEGLYVLVHTPRKVWRYCVNKNTETFHAILQQGNPVVIIPQAEFGVDSRQYACANVAFFTFSSRSKCATTLTCDCDSTPSCNSILRWS